MPKPIVPRRKDHIELRVNEQRVTRGKVPPNVFSAGRVSVKAGRFTKSFALSEFKRTSRKRGSYVMDTASGMREVGGVMKHISVTVVRNGQAAALDRISCETATPCNRCGTSNYDWCRRDYRTGAVVQCTFCKLVYGR